MKFLHELVNESRWLWGAAGAATITGLLGLLAQLAGYPWLIPSLGPSILMQSYMPHAKESGLHNVVIGQALGVVAGATAVLVSGARYVPAELISGVLHPTQVLAAVFAIVLTLLLQVLCRAVHPPGASTALLLATGSFRVGGNDLLTLTTGILLVGALGEPLRRWLARRLMADDAAAGKGR